MAISAELPINRFYPPLPMMFGGSGLNSDRILTSISSPPPPSAVETRLVESPIATANPTEESRWRRWSSIMRPRRRSYWTKYCLLCTVCGTAATILAGTFLVVAALFRYYTSSVHYFETIPTYIPAVLLSICGVSTIAFSWKRYRNIILLKITACWALVNAALSSVITITTSLIHMNRLQTIMNCENSSKNPRSCTCVSEALSYRPLDETDNGPYVFYVFENTPDCSLIHGTLYSCLRAVFAISVVAVLLSIFLCMLLYQLIGHERKKAYWSRIRRINSDWSGDFIACLARPMGRDRSGMLPLTLSPSGLSSLASPAGFPPAGMFWGPPPSYDEIRREEEANSRRQRRCSDSLMMRSSVSASSCFYTSGGTAGTEAVVAAPTFIAVPPIGEQVRVRNAAVAAADGVDDGSSGRKPAEFSFPMINATHPFSPTITLVEPGAAMGSQRNDDVRWGRARAGEGVQESVEDEDDDDDDMEDEGESTPVLGRRSSLSSGGEAGGGKSAKSTAVTTNKSRISRCKHGSLPNSPILMNVRKFVSFRLGDKSPKGRTRTLSRSRLREGSGDFCNAQEGRSSNIVVTRDEMDKILSVEIEGSEVGVGEGR